jgi:transcriptional regulator with XRE-family HTH domain
MPPYAQAMRFGERLRQAREAAKLTGEVLGGKLGVTRQAVSHWENGRYEPNLEQLQGLSGQLKVSADWLLGKEHVTLSAEAIAEAQFFDSLSPEDKRRWKTMRMAMFATAA